MAGDFTLCVYDIYFNQLIVTKIHLFACTTNLDQLHDTYSKLAGRFRSHLMLQTIML